MSARARDAEPVPRASLARLPELELGAGALVIADLHLDVENEARCAAFARWLARQRGAPALCVLGDLFDVWVGPAQATLGAAPGVLAALRELARSGTRLVVVPGNRDFLLDASFERASGAQLFAEGFVALVRAAPTVPNVPDIDGEPQRIAFVHGDTLCTRDHAYLRLRRVLRGRVVSWLGPRLPLALSRALARRLRRASVQAIGRKMPEEKSIQESAVREVAAVQRAAALVCGHAHEFRDVALAGGPRWIVLDAFGAGRDLVRVGARGLECVASGVEGESGLGARDLREAGHPPH